MDELNCSFLFFFKHEKKTTDFSRGSRMSRRRKILVKLFIPKNHCSITLFFPGIERIENPVRLWTTRTRDVRWSLIYQSAIRKHTINEQKIPQKIKTHQLAMVQWMVRESVVWQVITILKPQLLWKLLSTYSNRPICSSFWIKQIRHLLSPTIRNDTPRCFG